MPLQNKLEWSEGQLKIIQGFIERYNAGGEDAALAKSEAWSAIMKTLDGYEDDSHLPANAVDWHMKLHVFLNNQRTSHQRKVLPKGCTPARTWQEEWAEEHKDLVDAKRAEIGGSIGNWKTAVKMLTDALPADEVAELQAKWEENLDVELPLEKMISNRKRLRARASEEFCDYMRQRMGIHVIMFTACMVDEDNFEAELVDLTGDLVEGVHGFKETCPDWNKGSITDAWEQYARVLFGLERKDRKGSEEGSEEGSKTAKVEFELRIGDGDLAIPPTLQEIRHMDSKLYIPAVRKIMSHEYWRACGQCSIPWRLVTASPGDYLDLPKIWPPGVPFLEPSRLQYLQAKEVLEFWADQQPGFLEWLGYKGPGGVRATDKLYKTTNVVAKPKRGRGGKRGRPAKAGASGGAGVKTAMTPSNESDADTESDNENAGNNATRGRQAKRPAVPAAKNKGKAREVESDYNSPNDLDDPQDARERTVSPIPLTRLGMPLHIPPRAPVPVTAVSMDQAVPVEPANGDGYGEESNVALLAKLDGGQGSDAESDNEFRYTNEATIRTRARTMSPREAYLDPKIRPIFLAELSHEPAYTKALEHVLSFRLDTIENPIYREIECMPWAVWTYRKSRLPSKVHRNQQGLAEALQWLSAKWYASGDHWKNRSGELEQVVLAIGMILRDLEKAQFRRSPSDTGDAKDVVSNSLLSFAEIMPVLEVALANIATLNPPKCDPRPVRHKATAHQASPATRQAGPSRVPSDSHELETTSGVEVNSNHESGELSLTTNETAPPGSNMRITMSNTDESEHSDKEVAKQLAHISAATTLTLTVGQKRPHAGTAVDGNGDEQNAGFESKTRGAKRPRNRGLRGDEGSGAESDTSIPDDEGNAVLADRRQTGKAKAAKGGPVRRAKAPRVAKVSKVAKKTAVEIGGRTSSTREKKGMTATH